MYWLWTGTALIPEKAGKDVGLGLTLPIYVSGSASVSWWAMFITMLAIMTAFVSLVFAYFFFWTIHDNFPPDPYPGPAPAWPVTGAVLALGAWGLTMLARRRNRTDDAFGFYLGLLGSVLLALASGAALFAGPLLADLDPRQHVYPATVWLLMIWSAGHLALGILMHGYCVARRWAGRMTARHEIEIANVELYWHFCVLTVVITVLVIAGFPLVV
jgi:cytochrome c oxidase subunit I+III